MAQLVKCLLYNRENLNSDPKHVHKTQLHRHVPVTPGLGKRKHGDRGRSVAPSGQSASLSWWTRSSRRPHLENRKWKTKKGMYIHKYMCIYMNTNIFTHPRSPSFCTQKGSKGGAILSFLSWHKEISPVKTSGERTTCSVFNGIGSKPFVHKSVPSGNE